MNVLWRDLKQIRKFLHILQIQEFGMQGWEIFQQTDVWHWWTVVQNAFNFCLVYCFPDLHHIYSVQFQFYLYCTKPQQQSPQGTLYWYAFFEWNIRKNLSLACSSSSPTLSVNTVSQFQWGIYLSTQKSQTFPLHVITFSNNCKYEQLKWSRHSELYNSLTLGFYIKGKAQPLWSINHWLLITLVKIYIRVSVWN